MRLRLDPWATDYDTAFHADVDEAEAARATITPEVEYAEWRPIDPAPTEPLYDRLLFTDGSRRNEARVLLEDERRQLAFGALGTFGVGAVECCSRGTRRARYVEWASLGLFPIQRICTLSSGYQLEDFTLLPRFCRSLGRLEYRVKSIPDKDAEAVVRRLQFEMLEVERQLASRLTESYPDALVITDGPRPRMGGAPRVVGYLKTIHALPLSESHLAVVRRLEAGQRSPIYLVSHQDKSQQLFEWFLRLRDPRPWLYSFAGMVRLQAHAGSDPGARLPEVRRLADWLSSRLPTFATHAHQDPRAPQQLLPVRALEAELRRRMGNPQLVRRRLMQYLQEER